MENGFSSALWSAKIYHFSKVEQDPCYLLAHVFFPPQSHGVRGVQLLNIMHYWLYLAWIVIVMFLLAKDLKVKVEHEMSCTVHTFYFRSPVLLLGILMHLGHALQFSYISLQAAICRLLHFLEVNIPLAGEKPFSLQVVNIPLCLPSTSENCTLQFTV